MDDPESVECFVCYEQGNIQELSSLYQQTCLFKGKFDTEYVLSTLTRAAESLKKGLFSSPEVRNISLRPKISCSFMSLQKFQSKSVCT